MTRKPVRPRAAATADFDQISDFYLAEAGVAVALRLGDAVMAAFRELEHAPGIGSPLLGQRLGRPGLRTLAVSGFPYLICYFERPDYTDVWRILHGSRDLGAVLDQADFGSG